MDKRKLVNIIIKDLEEIKDLSQEVAESDDDSSLIIDLALNRARLLCQEIGLLRELAGNSTFTEEETYQVSFDKEEEDNAADFHYPDPELEILNFENREFSDSEELQDKEEEKELEDIKEEEENENDDLEEDKNDLTETQEELEEEVEEEGLNIREDLKGAIEKEKEEENEYARYQPKSKIYTSELKNEPQPGVREIHIDDPDDQDDIQPIRFTPPAASAVRPPMREIPKPEFLEPESPEKMVMGEKFHKEPSLNEKLGEKNPMESILTNGRISNLGAAIGLNDRFLFIREIFDNNSEKYKAVIEHLDKLEQISEAVEYLKANLSMQKNQASMKFVDLLKRRFTS